MDTSPILQKLQYNEAEHGWALDTGSFLAAWSTSIRGLAYSEDSITRQSLVRYARLYAFNIVHRLEQCDITMDRRAFEPKDLRQMDAVVAEVSAKVRRAASTAHRAFLLLGSATTFVELGLKSGMTEEYYVQLRDCADAAIRQLQEVPGQISADVEPELVRIELLRLGGNVTSVKNVLAGGKLVTHSGANKHKGPMVYQRELSSSSSEGFGCAEDSNISQIRNHTTGGVPTIQ